MFFSLGYQNFTEIALNCQRLKSASTGNPGLLQRHKAAEAQRHIGMDSPHSTSLRAGSGEAILIKACCFDYGAIIFRIGMTKQLVCWCEGCC